ncbi:MAG: hypothetical protein U9P12_09265, partial [Verrucomicrobiota bacterium]|nr:hypothetical protein [Verrucomicrobiota bacterium]
PLPELVMPPTAAEPKREPEPERLPPGFWERFGEALGIDLAPKIGAGIFGQGFQRIGPIKGTLEQRIAKQLHAMRLHRIANTELLKCIGVVDGGHDWKYKQKSAKDAKASSGFALFTSFCWKTT